MPQGPPKHPNIVPVIGVALDGGVCTVTPLATGGSLESRLQELNWFQRLKVASGCFDGLEALHAAGFVHGNLKSTNVLIADDGLEGMIADINPAPPSLEGMEQSVVNYYEPDFLKTGTAKTASDVYSLGVILLELLTSHKGQVPSLTGGESPASASGSVGDGGTEPMEALQHAAVNAGWPAEVAVEVVALAAACVRPNADRRKAAAVIARSLREVVEEVVESAGGVKALLKRISSEAGGKGDKSKEDPGLDFAAMSPEQLEEYERSAVKLQALQRGRAARAKMKKLRDQGADKEAIRKAEEEEEEAMKVFTGTPEQQAAAIKLQAAQRGKMAREQVKQMRKDATIMDKGKGPEVEENGDPDSGQAEAEMSAAEAEMEILQAEIFGRLAAMLSESDPEVQSVGAAALAVYTDRDECPDSHAAAENAVAAGVLAPLVSVFTSSNKAAVVEAAMALENISVELPAEQDRALRAGAMDACLRLISTTENSLDLRAAGARALRGLLLQNPAACRDAISKGALEVLNALMETNSPACQGAASLALSSLADADSEILQKLGVETLVGMAVKAKDPATRAGTIAFVSKLARDSDTHEQIRAAGGLELLVGMIMRLNEEAVWGLASMASVEDNWDGIAEAMNADSYESMKDLLELGGDYGKEGAAWAACYMAGDVRLQVALVKAGVLGPLVEMVKSGTRRCKKAAERALKALATTPM